MSQAPLYPIGLKILGRLCVVIGGGVVAARKIEGVLAAGGLVRVISPELVERIEHLVQAEEVEWLARGYEPGDLVGAFLVFAATDRPDVQRQVATEAEARGILLNIADTPTNASFRSRPWCGAVLCCSPWPPAATARPWPPGFALNWSRVTVLNMGC